MKFSKCFVELALFKGFTAIYFWLLCNFCCYSVIFIISHFESILNSRMKYKQYAEFQKYNIFKCFIHSTWNVSSKLQFIWLSYVYNIWGNSAKIWNWLKNVCLWIKNVFMFQLWFVSNLWFQIFFYEEKYKAMQTFTIFFNYRPF